jgi:hypothetical protein
VLKSLKLCVNVIVFFKDTLFECRIVTITYLFAAEKAAMTPMLSIFISIV